MKYKPNPIQVEGIELSTEILALAEQMAENAHDIWAKQRMSEGWHYGGKRDDEKKEHPCLVPYSELPESEKEFDRNMSQETLKYILAQGFKIIKSK